MDIQLATADEFEQVRDFYWDLIDTMQGDPYLPGWTKEVYPTSDELRGFVSRGELYIARIDGRIACAMALNHACSDGYDECPWQVEAAPDEVTIIHILCVHPDFAQRGLAKQLVEFAADVSKARGQKALRLDVLKGNLPAERLYPAMGFTLLKTVPLYYDDTGWADFELYERIL